MASTPGFASTPRVSTSVLLNGTATGTLETPTGTANSGSPVVVVSFMTAGSSGTRVDEIRAIVSQNVAVGSQVASVASTVNLYLWVSNTYTLFDQMLITAVTGSTTAVAWQQTRTYQNLVLPSGYEIRATIGAVGGTTQNTIRFTAFGADF